MTAGSTTFRISAIGLLLAGLVACACALLTVVIDASAGLAGWVAAFVFWSSVPVGCLPLILMMRLIPGSWREQLEPVAQVALLLIPIALLATLPILIGGGALFPWAETTRDGFQSIYLARWFLILRSAIFFIAIGITALCIASRPQWSTPAAVLGLVVFVPLHTLFAVDWLMSLDPDFHSSGFGLYVLSVQMNVALATLVVAWVARGTQTNVNVSGGLLLSGLLLWAYFAFMQYVIIWSDDLPSQVAWYQRRGAGFWSIVEIAIAALAFGPAFLLLFPPIRSSRNWLRCLACVVILAKALEIAWLIIPETGNAAVAVLSAMLALVGLVAISIATLQMARRNWRTFGRASSGIAQT